MGGLLHGGLKIHHGPESRGVGGLLDDVFMSSLNTQGHQELPNVVAKEDELLGAAFVISFQII